MTHTAVKSLKVGRLPQTEITVIDLDGVAFMLTEKQVVEAIQGLSKSLSGIHTNRQSGENLT